MPSVPETRYARSGDLHIAFQAVGDGPGDLIYIPSAFGHVETYWEEPSVAHFLRRLGSFARLLIFDKRGTGMSDRTQGVPTLEERIDDVRAVMEAAGSERAALFGMSEGGAIGALFAARFPERASHLVIMGSGALGYVTPEEAQLLIDDIERHWGNGEIIEKGAPSVAHDVQIRAWVGRMQHRSVSPGAMAALIKMNTSFDLRSDLALISAPTLVLHRTGDLLYAFEQGQYLAAHIRGARFVELVGTDHLPYFEDADRIVDLIEEFVTGAVQPRDAARPASRWAAPAAELTGREREVLRLLAAGGTNQRIASELFISLHTVSHHLRSIYAKTGATNRTEASAYAHRHRLV